MDLTYDVRVWGVEKYKGARATTYRVRWVVGGELRREVFATAAAADSFRSELVVWPDISPKHRKGIAEALTTATLALCEPPLDPAQAKAARSALMNWAFNRRRAGDAQPEEVTRLLAAIARRSRPLSDLAKTDVVGPVLNACATTVDGTRAAGRTAAWKRSILSTALNQAVESGLIDKNPVPSMKRRTAKSVGYVDQRAVINPVQARALLDAVAGLPRSGNQLVAFFATVYYSALRPEEALHLRVRTLELPASGWGWLTLDGSAAEVDKQWTDSGQRRDERELKHRAVGETRRVPCPPALTQILRTHLERYGTDAQGRLFRGERGGVLANVAYVRLWDRARQAALTPEQYDSPLARRPYDLRHAAVSTWLNGGVAPAQVAAWAGHSVEVLLRVYAKCLDGEQALAMQRIDQALAPGCADPGVTPHQPSAPESPQRPPAAGPYAVPPTPRPTRASPQSPPVHLPPRRGPRP